MQIIRSQYGKCLQKILSQPRKNISGCENGTSKKRAAEEKLLRSLFLFYLLNNLGKDLCEIFWRILSDRL